MGIGAPCEPKSPHGASLGATETSQDREDALAIIGLAFVMGLTRTSYGV